MRKLVAFACLCLQVGTGSGAPILLSAKTNLSVTAGGSSFAPVFSPDGRYLFFQSDANNIVADDVEGQALDLFMFDFDTSEIRLVSAGYSGPAGMTGSAAYPSASSNTMFVAFSTLAPLVPNDANLVYDVYLRDVLHGTNLAVTVRTDLFPFQVQTIGYLRPLLSIDASKVLIETESPGVFLRDFTTGSNISIRVGSPLRPGDDRSPPRPSMTSDARRVAFLSTNLDSHPGYRSTDVFVRDTQTNVTYWASRHVTNVFGQTLTYQCLNPVISADGNVVVYKAVEFPGSTNASVFRYDLVTSETTVLSRNLPPSFSPPDTTVALSADGRFAAFERNSQIYVYDAETQGNSVVSVEPSGQPANGTSIRPVLSRDGSMIAFASTARDLVSPPLNGTNFQLFVKNLITGTTRLTSFNTNREPSSAGVRDAVPSLSPDGLRIAFDYDGSDLVAGDYNSQSDVFVYNWNSDSISLISQSLPERPSSTGSAGVTSEISLSADGKLLAFSTYDDPGVTGDSNGVRDAFLADMASGQIRALFARTNAFSSAQTMRPQLSANGRAALLVEETFDVFVGTGVEQGYTQRLFWRDLVNGVTQEVDPTVFYGSSVLFYGNIPPAVISRRGDLVAYPTPSHSFPTPYYLRDMPSGAPRAAVTNRYGYADTRGIASPIFSPDQRWLIFQSADIDITADPVWVQSGRYALYARDLQSNLNYLVSITNFLSITGITRSFSASGELMAYDTLVFPLLQYASIHVFDFRTLTNTFVCSDCARPSLSGDGRLVAFTAWRRGSRPEFGDIYVQDRFGGTRALISQNYATGQPANAASDKPIITANGRYVVFTSKASDLVPDDAKGVADLFVRDRFRGTTYLLSASDSGEPGNAASRPPLASADGLTLAFQSYANNLIPNDYNHAADIFVVRLGAGDSDADGLDDAWEITYFGNLQRDGSGDADSDGHTDFEEFIAGTDPTDTGSHLEVISIQSVNNSMRLLWAATPGRDYQLQMKPGLNAGTWTNLSPLIRATSQRMAWSYSPASDQPQAFYRVALVQ